MPPTFFSAAPGAAKCRINTAVVKAFKQVIEFQRGVNVFIRLEHENVNLIHLGLRGLFVHIPLSHDLLNPRFHVGSRN